MKPIALCYHDVTLGQHDRTGFPGPDAASYKLPLALFQNHLAAIVTAEERRVRPVERLGGLAAPLLTFDDGGASAYPLIANELERFGQRGLFFIPTDFIGRPGFLRRDQIQALHDRGHVIGSHSCSHRGRMSRHSSERLRAEWGVSVEVLSAITRAPVTTASVPSGFYSSEVGRSAARAGIRVLFTQQPSTRSFDISGCRIVGRYTVRPWTDAPTILALALGRRAPQWRQWNAWALKKLAKSVGGGSYSALRKQYFVLRDHVRRENPV